MKPTLLWTFDGHCTNPPGAWAGTITVHDDIEAWSWEARYAGDSYTAYGMPTAEAAQRACEAALWRLGVLPLPEWTRHGRHWECHRILDGGSFRAEVSLWRDLGRLTWIHVGRGPHAMAACDLHLGGQWDTVAVAKARAEAHLRAEIAAALEAQNG